MQPVVELALPRSRRDSLGVGNYRSRLACSRESIDPSELIRNLQSAPLGHESTAPSSQRIPDIAHVRPALRPVGCSADFNGSFERAAHAKLMRPFALRTCVKPGLT